MARCEARREHKRMAKLESRRRTAIRRLQRLKDDLSESDRDFADSLIAQWQRNGRLTDTQWSWVRRLSEIVRPGISNPRLGPCYIYGIVDDGSRIKIGISKDPKSRRRDLQVANPRPLTLPWTVLAPNRTIAESVERKIHRHLKAHRIAGEWFDLDGVGNAEALARNLLAQVQQRIMKRIESRHNRTIGGIKSQGKV